MLAQHNAKEIIILGSTGTIGRNTIDVILNSSKSFSVYALAAGSNYKLLAEQAKIVKPKKIILSNEQYYQNLKAELIGYDIDILSGFDAIIEVLNKKVDMVMVGIDGIKALLPLEQAIKSGSNIALSNKESIVCGGNFILDLAKQYNVQIIPVDSEHNAIFQLLEAFDKDKNNLEKIILTASGGPFLNFDKDDLLNVTKEQALKHPNWVMGAKVTIDSATMVNKSLEFIEAHYLFDLPSDKIDIMIHPQSIVHGFLQLNDGSTMAHMGYSDMRVPIAHALTYPDRDNNKLPNLDLTKILNLSFFDYNIKQFPVIDIVKKIVTNHQYNDAIKFNAANEVAVDLFLKDKISFCDIVNFIIDAMQIEFTTNLKISNIQQIIAYDELIKAKLYEKFDLNIMV